MNLIKVLGSTVFNDVVTTDNFIIEEQMHTSIYEAGSVGYELQMPQADDCTPASLSGICCRSGLASFLWQGTCYLGFLVVLDPHHQELESHLGTIITQCVD